jgi:hypothetical protein
MSNTKDRLLRGKPKERRVTEREKKLVERQLR